MKVRDFIDQLNAKGISDDDDIEFVLEESGGVRRNTYQKLNHDISCNPVAFNPLARITLRKTGVFVEH